MDDLTLYAFLPETGELLGSFKADRDPEGDGFLIPWGATKDVPPAAEAGQALVFKDATWSLVQDHRGQTWYDAAGDAVEIGQLGDPAGFNPPLSAIAPPPTPTDLAKYAKRKRDETEAAGITLNGVALGSGPDDQTRVANAYAGMQTSGTETIRFKATAGFIELTLAQVKAVGNALFAHTQACFDAEEQADVGLNANPPTITTTAQIDQIFAAVSSAF